VTGPGSPGAAARALRWTRERDGALSVFLVLLLFSTIFAWPLRAVLPRWTFDLVLVSTVAFGVLAVIPSPRIAVVAAVLGAGVTAERIAGPAHMGLPGTLTALAYFMVIAGALLARVFRPGAVNVHRLLGAVALFIVLGVTFGFAFHAVEIASPGAIRANGIAADMHDTMWLSFLTITTLGYDDVVPVAPMARSLAALEGLVGILFPSLLIGFLLSDFARGRARDEEHP
jgi:voltage-gated potassium channel Kch